MIIMQQKKMLIQFLLGVNTKHLVKHFSLLFYNAVFWITKTEIKPREP